MERSYVRSLGGGEGDDEDDGEAVVEWTVRFRDIGGCSQQFTWTNCASRLLASHTISSETVRLVTCLLHLDIVSRKTYLHMNCRSFFCSSKV